MKLTLYLFNFDRFSKRAHKIIERVFEAQFKKKCHTQLQNALVFINKINTELNAKKNKN